MTNVIQEHGKSRGYQWFLDYLCDAVRMEKEATNKVQLRSEATDKIRTVHHSIVNSFDLPIVGKRLSI